MNKYLLIATLLLAACGHDDHHRHSQEESAGEHHEHESSELIELSGEQAERFGVTFDEVQPGEFASVIRCSGIVDRSAANLATASAPSAGVVRFAPGITQGVTISRGTPIATIDFTAVSGGNENLAAAAAVEAARKELERIKPLYDERLATQADYNAAVAALKQAEAAYSPAASCGHVHAPISGVVTQLLVADGTHVAAGDPIATFATDNSLTLHAEVTADSYAALQNISDARIGSYTLSEHDGKRTGISAENGYACIYFTFSNDGNIMPGSGVDVYLLGQPRQNVISLPLAAVTEQQGTHYVYRRHSPGHYEKLPVTLGESDGLRVEILSGVNAGDNIVTSGAMTVRLAESNGAIPEGHTHNH